MILTRGAPAIILPSRWQNEPSGPLEVNPNNEFARGLAAAVVGDQDAINEQSIRGARMTYVGGVPHLDFTEANSPFCRVPVRPGTWNGGTLLWQGRWTSSAGNAFAFPASLTGDDFVFPSFSVYVRGGTDGSSRRIGTAALQASLPGGNNNYWGSQLTAPLSMRLAYAWGGTTSGQNDVYRGGTEIAATGFFGASASITGLTQLVLHYGPGAGKNYQTRHVLSWQSRVLSAAEIAEVEAAPYQMLRRRQRRIYSLLFAGALGPGLPTDPAITTVTDNVGSVTGSVPNGGSTDDTTPTFAGTASPLSTVRLLRDGIVVASGAANASGAWTLTPTLPFGGPNDYQVEQRISDIIEVSDPWVLTIGGTAPVITHVVDDEGAETGNLPSGSTTDDLTPRVVGTGTPGATVTVRANGLLVGTTAVASDGSWSVVVTLGNSTYNITARQTLGGVDSSDSAAFVLTVSRAGSGQTPGAAAAVQRYAPLELLAFRPITIDYNGVPGVQGVITYILADAETVAEWTARAYAVGEQAKRLGKIWESLKTGNTDIPGDGALTWVYVRPSNGTASFDGSPGTAIRAAAGRVQMEVRIDVAADTVCLLGAQGHRASIAVYRNAVAQFVYTSGTRSLWMRRYPEGELIPDSLRFYQLDIRPGDILIVLVESTGEAASLQDLAVGMSMPLGEPQRPSEVGQTDFSRRSFSETGALQLTRRRFSRGFNVACILPFEDGEADAALSWLEDRRATVLCFSFIDEYRRFSGLAVTDSPKLSYENPLHATLQLRVDGAT